MHITKLTILHWGMNHCLTRHMMPQYCDWASDLISKATVLVGLIPYTLIYTQRFRDCHGMAYDYNCWQAILTR